ncbi:SEC-C domain-containing protein [Flammeovirga yaeyamensis]|uniref:SEC-C domain-containing protein n=2 Tax=Flammeovirga yaeyamensis TaxID=367791 RepID=A0AAX1NFT6_9BACT|nr:YchJ family metal-binding protein [Flammeovirga yaeyamensis]MBB3696916.1 SEC-C motif-containing protein [Flammeovirga yaeyamensis]NMF33579.1 Sec-C motif domain protein [Flammeovirga yaeyamensis]QWG05153.1 SEC-C domain-containing protein [Flammeovirga yaeyamensis]
MENNACPCGSKKTYKECCGIAHNDIRQVKTAEQLMRSRYSAFTLANGEYLNLSHHSKTRPQGRRERRDLVKWAKSVKWDHLEVLQAIKGSEDDVEGVVEFKAYFRDSGGLQVIHEKSTFIKENGHWVYDTAL